MNFKEFKKEVLRRSKKEGECASQYKRALKSSSYEELAQVVKDNIYWNRESSIVTADLANTCYNPHVWNSGKENSGLFNSGDWNSGYWNSGDMNSGDRNSGDMNSGIRNSGELNSGYRNSGVFCNRKVRDTILFFNKESNMTWLDWYSHPVQNVLCRFKITSWIKFESMSEEERKEHPNAAICGGYLKKFSYHEAWANLWKTLTDDQKSSFKTLPNFDSDIFYEITGIKI